MKLEGAPDAHLTYCTNIHPGESWKDVRLHLERSVLAVRRALAVERMGVGLRLSALAACELARPGELATLRDWLSANGLYVFTLNGFPYGPFHGRAVKEAVYEPDWRTPERLAYSNQLAELLAGLVPEGQVGSISTLPGAFRPRVRHESDLEAIVGHLVAHALHLNHLRQERGVTLALALEPEPACLLETTAEAVAFFERRLLAREVCAQVARATSGSPSEAEGLIRRHLGLCLDACHSAVEMEDPDQAVDLAERAGVRVHKLQISAGLRVAEVGADTEECLRPFDDGVYLHQVVEQRGSERRHFLDLADAFAGLSSRDSAPPDASARMPAEWRIHLHVPIFREPAAPLASTREHLARLLERQRTRPFTQHLEVETYTWDVLPPEHRGSDVIADIAAELRWARERLGA